ncbi:MAG: dihydrofolate reductase [Candidatus Harrisonbacteria bacterium]|nr:dihydrofolate reductase [Candidatus Harrisonbacteria bacterium]
MLSIIVALDKKNGIGSRNGLPWTLPADLKHFKEVTMGHPIIMGRKTHESIGRALPGRKNIIITRQKDYAAPGCEVVDSLEGAIAAADSSLRGDPTAVGLTKQSHEVFVIGGGEIFAQVLPRVQKLYVTEVNHEFPADVYFPEFNKNEWREVSREPRAADEKNPYEYSFVVYERR